MFFAKPRLSAAVINCADCPASLISGSLAFVTVYPPLSLSLSTRVHPSTHPSPPSFVQTISLFRSLAWTPSIASPHPPSSFCLRVLRPPLLPVFPISNGRAVRAPRNWPANEPFRVKSCTGVVYRVVVLNFCRTCGAGWNDRSGYVRACFLEICLTFLWRWTVLEWYSRIFFLSFLEIMRNKVSVNIRKMVHF